MKNHRTKHLNTTIACTSAGYCCIVRGIIIEDFISWVHLPAENSLGFDLKSIIWELPNIESHSQSIKSVRLFFCFSSLVIISSKDGVWGYSHSVVKVSKSSCWHSTYVTLSCFKISEATNPPWCFILLAHCLIP